VGTEVELDDVYVPREAVVEASAAPRSSLYRCWDASAWSPVTSAPSKVLERAIGYSGRGKAYVEQFQANSHRISDMKVRLEAARLLTWRAAWYLDRVRDNSLDASITRLFASESLVRLAFDTVQIFGGYGFMTDYGVEPAMRDAVANSIYKVRQKCNARWLGVWRAGERTALSRWWKESREIVSGIVVDDKRADG
jgi:alkylation response protein AidB-like acyl-CoA dehydrogenase